MMPLVLKELRSRAESPIMLPQDFTQFMQPGLQSQVKQQLQQQHNINHSLYKTELCRSFEETRTCRYGSKCQFAHGRDELRFFARHPKYKTEICKTFMTNGMCPYGKRCRFIHPSPQSSTLINLRSDGDPQSGIIISGEVFDIDTGSLVQIRGDAAQIQQAMQSIAIASSAATRAAQLGITSPYKGPSQLQLSSHPSFPHHMVMPMTPEAQETENAGRVAAFVAADVLEDEQQPKAVPLRMTRPPYKGSLSPVIGSRPSYMQPGALPFNPSTLEGGRRARAFSSPQLPVWIQQAGGFAPNDVSNTPLSAPMTPGETPTPVEMGGSSVQPAQQGGTPTEGDTDPHVRLPIFRMLYSPGQ